MLTAFSPRPIIELKQRDKSKVESILAYGNRLLVGLSTGTLRVYRVNEAEEDDADEEHTAESHGITTNTAATTAEEGRPSTPPVPAQRKPPLVELLREVEKFSRRAVEQLAIVKEANILFCLSDACVSIHDLQSENYALQEQLAKTKGASTLAVTSNIHKDPISGVPSIVSRLAVAAKRKLLLWSWHDTELSSSAVEVTLSAAARTLTWASGSKLICGLNSGYVAVDVDSLEVSAILGPGGIGGAAGGQDEHRFGSLSTTGMGYMGMGNWVPKPLAATLTDGELLLAKDVNTIFIDKDGRALDRRQIQWTTAPEVIAFSYPYLLALQPPSRGVLEVRSPKTLSLLQAVSVPNANKIQVPQAGVSLSHAGKGVLVASSRCVWRMTAHSYDSQISQLLEKGRLDEAISMIDMLEDVLLENKEERLREVKMQKAESLFRRRRYRAALDLFTEVAAPPERVIRLYPSIIAGDTAGSDAPVRRDTEASDTATSGDQAADAPADGDVIKTEPASSAAGSPSKAEGKPKEESVPGKLTKKEPKKDDGADNSDAGSLHAKNSDSASADVALQGRDLNLAILELYSFLADTRRRLQTVLEPDGSLKPIFQAASDAEKRKTLRSFVSSREDDAADADADLDPDTAAQMLRDVAKLVDTTLFRAYMVERPARAGSLFRIPNFCDQDVVRQKLLETRRYEDLVDFFHGKKLHREALELLQRFGRQQQQQQQQQADAAAAAAAVAASDDAPAALRGPKRTVAYLQNLPPAMLDLTLEFARWPLLEDRQLGMEVFLADTENAESLARDKVLSFLEGIDAGLAVTYLEHIITELNDLTPEFHQRLVRLYLDRLKRPEGPSSPSHAFKDQEERRAWVERMQAFLKSSSQYSTGKTFNLLPKDDPEFFEARAIVLSKMGNHRQALEIYVFKLRDHGKAEEYCNHIHLTQEAPALSKQSSQEKYADEKDAAKSIYHALLSLYLAPPPPYAADWAAALNILSKHGSRLPAASILRLIPPSLPVQSLQSYFRGRLRVGTSTVNEGRVLRGLCATEHERTRAALMLGHAPLLGSGSGSSGGSGGSSARGGGGGSSGDACRNRHVVISEEKVCRVCHKRLGRSVISVFPDNSVVHYGCANRVRSRG